MIFILLLCFVFGTLLVTFAIAPFFSKQSRTFIADAPSHFANQEELTALLLLRDSLLEEQSCHGDSFEKLVEVCERLKQHGVPWNKGLGGKSQEGGFLNIRCAFFVLLVSCLGVFVSLHGNAQEALRAPERVTIPPPNTTADGFWIPSVNQYILLPSHGKLYVYYVGMFSNPSAAPQAPVLLPFPKGVRDLHFSEGEKILLNKAEGQTVLATMPLKEGVNQIRAEFALDASLGKVEWVAGGVTALAGVTLIIMPEYTGVLRSLFPSFAVWPARVVDMPSEFRTSLTTQPLFSTTTASNDAMRDVQTRMFVRMASGGQAFPTFTVNGIVPSDTYFYAMTAFFACFLFASAGFFIFKKSQANP